MSDEEETIEERIERIKRERSFPPGAMKKIVEENRRREREEGERYPGKPVVDRPVDE